MKWEWVHEKAQAGWSRDFLVAEDGREILSLSTKAWGGTKPSDEDAALIAAAPELKAEIDQLKAEIADQNDFMAFMQAELAAQLAAETESGPVQGQDVGRINHAVEMLRDMVGATSIDFENCSVDCVRDMWTLAQAFIRLADNAELAHFQSHHYESRRENPMNQSIPTIRKTWVRWGTAHADTTPDYEQPMVAVVLYAPPLMAVSPDQYMCCYRGTWINQSVWDERGVVELSPPEIAAHEQASGVKWVGHVPSVADISDDDDGAELSESAATISDITAQLAAAITRAEAAERERDEIAIAAMGRTNVIDLPDVVKQITVERCNATADLSTTRELFRDSAEKVNQLSTDLTAARSELERVKEVLREARRNVKAYGALGLVEKIDQTLSEQPNA